MSTQTTRIEHIRERLQCALQPSFLQVVDDSHLHVGHTGHQGGGHFTIHIVAAQFAKQSLLARHRLVYAALHTLIPTTIHALRIRAQTEEEQYS